MLNQFSRTELLIGKENIEKLHNSKVAIFGLGGVGSFVAEGLIAIKEFFSPDSPHDFIDSSVNYIVDAIDTVTGKIALVMLANEMNIPIISAMGTGNKLDPTMLEVSDIYKTEMCPLAKVMRKELRNRGIKKLKVVYSKEKPMKVLQESESSCKTNCICPPGTKRKCALRNQVPGSISFVPSVAGMIMAGEVVKDLIK